MWFQRAFIASRGSSVIAVAMDQDGRIDTIMNIFLTVKRNILEYCLDNRRTDSKYIASILREVMERRSKIILQLALRGTDFHGAATTSRHVLIAAARSTR